MSRAVRAVVAALLLPVAHPAVSALVVIIVTVTVRDGVALGVSTAAVMAGLALVVAKLLPGLARPLMRMHGAWRRSVMTAVRALMRPPHGAGRSGEERPAAARGRVKGGDYAS